MASATPASIVPCRESWKAAEEILLLDGDALREFEYAVSINERVSEVERLSSASKPSRSRRACCWISSMNAAVVVSAASEKKRTGALECFRDNVGHLRLRVGDEIAARLIELACEFVRDIAGLFAQLLRSLFPRFVGGGLCLRLRALFVPFGRFVQVFDGLGFRSSRRISKTDMPREVTLSVVTRRISSIPPRFERNCCKASAKASSVLARILS